MHVNESCENDSCEIANCNLRHPSGPCPTVLGHTQHFNKTYITILELKIGLQEIDNSIIENLIKENENIVTKLDSIDEKLKQLDYFQEN